jgi:hypothetical protein
MRHVLFLALAIAPLAGRVAEAPTRAALVTLAGGLNGLATG